MQFHRPWQAVGATLVMLYAVALLIVAVTSADLGFVALHGDVMTVEDGSGAAEAGLQRGDTIIAVNGVDVSASGRIQALRALPPGESITLEVERAGSHLVLEFSVVRTLPIGSAAGIFMAGLMLFIALIADRGTGRRATQAFFRQTLGYVVFLAGAFSFDVVTSHSALAVPWIFAMAFIAPQTCQNMLIFPAGRSDLGALASTLLYGPPLILGVVMSAAYFMMIHGGGVAAPGEIFVHCGLVAGILGAVYLSIGAISRIRRVRSRRSEIDPVAARWLQINSLFLAVPLIGAVLWAIRDVDEFVAGGFVPFVAAAMVGGTTFLTLAFTRTPFGELDRLWRRSSGYFLATLLASGLYLMLIALFGRAALEFQGASFSLVLAATLAAAILFGPLRRLLQQMVDERFGRDRRRARRLLRDAAEAAVATLDIGELYAGLATQVRAALSADGAAIYVAGDVVLPTHASWENDDHDVRTDDALERRWTREAIDGTVEIDPVVIPGEDVAEAMERALELRAPVELCENLLVVPLCDARVPTALVVTPREERSFDDEERELLMTAVAHLVVALRNARAHTELEELNRRLLREVEIAEERRREIARLKDRVEAENRELIGQLAGRAGRAPVIGKGLRPTFDLVQRTAHSEASVLVRGETGVGKELVARAIHAASSRRDGPFIVVDCGAIASGVFESVLFGHEKGAFTGAVRTTQGAFRSAHGGTIFLDEIGELPLELQPKLLRVLQEREVVPVGSNQPVQVDVRVVAGTNRDLAAEVAAGAFRQDLLYRLRVVEIVVPALRQRRGDIPALAEHFLSINAQRSGRSIKQILPDAMTALCEYDWPGNVRELEHCLEAAVVYCDGDEIRPQDLPIYDQLFIERGKRALSENDLCVVTDGAPKAGLRQSLEELEKQRLVEALEQHNGNRTHAAKALGMSRGALLRRIKRYDLVA